MDISHPHSYPYVPVILKPYYHSTIHSKQKVGRVSHMGIIGGSSLGNHLVE